MNDSRTHSLSHSVSAHVPTHDRKGREGNRKGRDALLHASLTYWSQPRPVDNPLASAAAALGSRVGCRSAIAGWVR